MPEAHSHPEWRVEEIVIGTAKPVRVAAWVCGLWALDLRLFEMGPDDLVPGWGLTHRPTGMFAAAIIESLEESQSIVARIDALGNWNFPGQDVPSHLKLGMAALRAGLPDVLSFRQAKYGPGFYFKREVPDARPLLTH